MTVDALSRTFVTDAAEELWLVDVSLATGIVSTFIFENDALSAPFAPWVERANDLGIRSCSALLQNLRIALRGLPPVRLDAPELPHLEVSVSQLDAFRRNVTRFLNNDEQDLERIQRIFDLNITDLG